MATPVRNVRIADPMWEKLGKLASKRKTTITALLVEGAEYILDFGEYSKPNPQSLAPNEETLTRLEALEENFQALALRVTDLGGQLEGQITAKTPTDNALLVPLADEALTETINALTQRLDRIEKAIAPLIQALEQIPQEVSVAAPLRQDVQPQTLPPGVKLPLTQTELAKRLGTSTQNLSNRRGKGSAKDKAHFEAWSKSHDPDNVAWTWVGRPGGKGIRMRYVPAKVKSQRQGDRLVNR